jgi:hypothetical protein
MMIDSSGSSITKRKSKNTKLIPLQGNLDTINHFLNTPDALNAEINNPLYVFCIAKPHMDIRHRRKYR